MVGLLHAMAFMVLLLIGWVIWNNKPLPLLHQSLTKFVLNGEVHRMTSFLRLCFNCHVVSSTCIDSAVQWTAWYAVARATWKRRRGAKVKIEDNIQRDSSFNVLQNMLVLVSYLAQVAKHQMTGLSRFGVHIYITFWVELNVNKVYISQATFFMAVAACIQHCI